MASSEAGAFYEQLVRPSWAPPGWLFAPVWTVLYVLMGIAAWLVWRVHGFKEGRAALVLFILQLGANALWTWVFFVWQQGALAFAEVILLWCLCRRTHIRRLAAQPQITVRGLTSDRVRACRVPDAQTRGAFARLIRGVEPL